MTDYLESLMELQEQKENEELLEWRRPALSLATQGQQKEKRQSTDEIHTNQKVETEQLRERRQWEQERVENRHKRSNGEENAEMARSDAVMESAWTTEMTRLYRAVRRSSVQTSRGMGPGTAALDRSGNGPWSVGLPAVRGIDYAALVDRAFARDARRYDGRLGLL